MTAIDLTTVRLEPKYFLYLVLAVVMIVLAIGIGIWGANKLKSLTSTVVAKSSEVVTTEILD